MWSTNIEKDTIANKDWRRVVHTSKNLQVVLMAIPPGESLGLEVHPVTDQFFRVERGAAILQTGKKENRLVDGSSAVVPSGVWHNLTNTSKTRWLKLYTIYSPPHHPKNRVDKTKADEVAREAKKNASKKK